MKQTKMSLKQIHDYLQENPTTSLKEIYKHYNVDYNYNSVKTKMWKLAKKNKIIYQYDSENQDYINLVVTDEKIINKYKSSAEFEAVEREIIYSHLNVIEELDKIIFNSTTITKDKLKAIELRQREYKYENNKYAVDFYKEKNQDEI
ncbi:hypothetical protein [Gemella cuniculi]|uniref:hypothetical protein n=1 Tax=Gemella cuniculi TaxID=150240 RepID=UPI0003FBB320|nr:hypothetical protein [Gemella cuniculi]